MESKLTAIFQHSYQQLRPGASLPQMRAQFFPFVGLKNTIALRGTALHAKVSDQLKDAPDSVLEALAHQLLAKVLRERMNAAQVRHYRQYLSSHEVSARAHSTRQARGRKQITSPQGDIYHLEEIFDQLNQRYFGGTLGRPQLTWSAVRGRRRLGHYDSAHNVIVVSRIFDHHEVPRYAVEYILYHEMLHLKHPVKLQGSRRCVHGKEFKADEKRFPQLQQATAFLKTL